MNDALTCLSFNYRKDQDEQATMLSKIWCLASCGQFVHLYHLFCISYFTSTVLFIINSGTLIEFNLLDHHVVLLSGLLVSQQFGKHFGTAVNIVNKLYILTGTVADILNIDIGVSGEDMIGIVIVLFSY